MDRIRAILNSPTTVAVAGLIVVVLAGIVLIAIGAYNPLRGP